MPPVFFFSFSFFFEPMFRPGMKEIGRKQNTEMGYRICNDDDIRMRLWIFFLSSCYI